LRPAPLACLPPFPLQLDPSNVHAYFNRGISNDKRGSHAAAVDDFSACIKLDPGNAVAYYNRASCFDALGQFEHAVGDYRRALDAEK
jgi:tetratricopeptide (TPR) repeat protein